MPASLVIDEGIIKSNTFKEIFNYVELQQIYELSRHQSKDFLHSKEDYIKISKALLFMMSEKLFICPCDEIFDNHFWDHFEFALLFNKMKH